MAWTTPTGVVTGDELTVARWNDHVVANLTFLYAPDRVRAVSNANQSITTATLSALLLQTETFDTNAMHDLVTNNNRVICKVAGAYLILGAAQFANSAAVRNIATIRLNGTTTIGQSEMPGNAAGTFPAMTPTALYVLAVNDYVELMVYQDSGGNINLQSGAWLAMMRLGA